MKNEAKEAEFQTLFGKLTEKQQDSILGMERKFTVAAQLHRENAAMPPDDPPRGAVRAASDTGL